MLLKTFHVTATWGTNAKKEKVFHRLSYNTEMFNTCMTSITPPAKNNHNNLRRKAHPINHQPCSTVHSPPSQMQGRGSEGGGDGAAWETGTELSHIINYNTESFVCEMADEMKQVTAGCL